MFIFNTLAPIFILIAVGAPAFHFRFLDQATLRGINRLTYWVNCRRCSFTAPR